MLQDGTEKPGFVSIGGSGGGADANSQPDSGTIDYGASTDGPAGANCYSGSAWFTSLPSYPLMVYLSVIMVTCIMYVYDMFNYFYDVFPCAHCTRGFGLRTFFLLTYSVACVHRVLGWKIKQDSVQRRNVPTSL